MELNGCSFEVMFFCSSLTCYICSKHSLQTFHSCQDPSLISQNLLLYLESRRKYFLVPINTVNQSKAPNTRATTVTTEIYFVQIDFHIGYTSLNCLPALMAHRRPDAKIKRSEKKVTGYLPVCMSVTQQYKAVYQRIQCLFQVAAQALSKTLASFAVKLRY